jgi:hypothetical protein
MDDPNLYAVTPSDTGTKPSYHGVYITIIVILFLIGLGFAIWAVIGWTRRRDEKDRTVTMATPKITADNTSVGGSWGTLSSESDKVTLYVSEGPLNPGSDGTIPCDGSTVKCAHATGSNGSLTITSGISKNTTYNAMLIATGEDTSSYKTYGRKVFTQQTSDLPGKLFNIKNLISPNGAVSENAGYTTVIDDVGIFGFGSAETGANAASDSFIIKYDGTDIPNDETGNILCRDPANNTLILAEWTNHDDPGDNPNIVYDTSAGDTVTIPVTNCQWSYNDAPPTGVEGENKWCLTATQSVSVNNTTEKEVLCMERNGQSIELARSTLTTDTWFNHFASSSS